MKLFLCQVTSSDFFLGNNSTVWEFSQALWKYWKRIFWETQLFRLRYGSFRSISLDQQISSSSSSSNTRSCLIAIQSKVLRGKNQLNIFLYQNMRSTHRALQWLKLSVYNTTVHEQFIQFRLRDYYFQRKWSEEMKRFFRSRLLKLSRD